ncbi:hypothetical protein K488DRAFT_49194 [Vararia minispora EC-137]|uniref:Uncharacterized protein n=1 Tax=Vararia minispora EC-137 TaxID=1314806 RepID=A0ACB8QLN6_9AGAM|nr:hypothetical protein K488DRAFT_49194 [Vararia minispora EC-137]
MNQKAWWLDVASPTWEDMRAIGKLLHLHPLTLEDILQQEPREKLELFPSLGYYFTVFRAVKSWDTHSGVGESATVESGVDEIYVYLVVFKQGVCTVSAPFHVYHVERVRNKVYDLDNAVSMSSAWIAHGLIDSIVDSFFPVLEHIEIEAAEIEKFYFSKGKASSVNPTMTNLRRMARTRRLVTTLGRVLATKGEVVGRLKKRLLTGEHGVIGQDDVEVAIYLGDVQDHILSLQQSLAHYERVLSQSHQTYLQHLRAVVSRGRSNQDFSVMLLTIVSIGVLPCQVIIGLFSLNVTVPQNSIPDGPYHWFGGMLTLCGVAMILYILVVRHWWRSAKRKIRRSALL